MNTTILRLVISLAVAIAVFFVIELVAANLAENQNVVTITIIFIGIAFAIFVSPTSGKVVSNYVGSDGGGDEETGTVKWFNIKKGYGFITRDSGDDVFVHYRNILGSGRRSISDGQRVKFVVIDGDKGLQADEVEAI